MEEKRSIPFVVEAKSLFSLFDSPQQKTSEQKNQ